MVGLAQYHLQRNSPIELRFSVWQVPSRIIRLKASKEIAFWVGYQLGMFLSDFQGTSSEFLGDLKEGRLEFLLVSQSFVQLVLSSCTAAASYRTTRYLYEKNWGR
jgi:hypothetical protein